MTSLSIVTPEPSLTIRELSREEMPQIERLTLMLNAPHLDSAGFHRHLERMLGEGYRCVGAWVDGELVAVMGFWIFTRFWCGTQMDVDNVIVDADYRRMGLGKKLLAWLENKAAAEGIETVVMDSYSAAEDAHRFYFGLGYVIKGYHFIKPLVTRPLTGKAQPPLSLED